MTFLAGADVTKGRWVVVVLENREFKHALGTDHPIHLRQRLGPVDLVALNVPNTIEAHPEVCSRAMKGEPLDYSKHSWNGQAERRRLIAGAGIDLPGHIPEAGKVPPDDVLDAAAVAWTAWRVVPATAKVLPEPAKDCDRRQRNVIWYYAKSGPEAAPPISPRPFGRAGATDTKATIVEARRGGFGAVVGCIHLSRPSR